MKSVTEELLKLVSNWKDGFKGAFMVGLYGKFSDFFIDERHKTTSFIFLVSFD